MKELLPVMQAFAEGAEIESRSAQGEWFACLPGWVDGVNYRIKPTPREWWLNVFEAKTTRHESEAEANASVLFSDRLECVHVREVL